MAIYITLGLVLRIHSYVLVCDERSRQKSHHCSCFNISKVGVEISPDRWRPLTVNELYKNATPDAYENLSKMEQSQFERSNRYKLPASPAATIIEPALEVNIIVQYPVWDQETCRFDGRSTRMSNSMHKDYANESDNWQQ